MGHWNNSLDFVYAKMGDSGLGAEFRKAQNALSILSSENVQELKEIAEKQANRLLALERENSMLWQRLDTLESRYAKEADLDRKMLEVEMFLAKLKK